MDSSPQEPDNARNELNGHGTFSYSTESIFLDFLYPTKTLALVKRLSTYGLERWEGRRARLAVFGRPRQYSSIADTVQENVVENEAAAETNNVVGRVSNPTDNGHKVLITDRVPARYHVSDPRKALLDLLKSGNKYSQKEAWYMFLQMDSASRTPKVVSNVLEYLALSPRIVDAQRAVSLFLRLDEKHRLPTSYKAAIVSYVQLGRADEAVSVHEEALSKASASRFGTDFLLANTIHTRQWDLALHVYDSYMHFWTYCKNRERAPPLWDFVNKLPNLIDDATALLSFFKHSLGTSYEGLLSRSNFLSDLVVRALSQSNVDDQDKSWELFQELRSVGLATRNLYEELLFRLLSSPIDAEYSNQPKLFSRVYRVYRGESDFRPSKKLLHALMRRLCDHQVLMSKGGLSAETVLADFRKTYGHVDSRTLALLLRTYARAGAVTKVYQYHDELHKTGQPSEMHPAHFQPLIYVHARRGEVSKAQEQFDRISQEFGLKPDLGCWNVLIHAYARADDLEGACRCFNDMLDAGITPGAHAYGPILHLCAQRGDVESTEALLNLAISKNVVKSSAMIGSLVLAHVNNDDIEAAEKVAQAAVAEKQEQKLHGSLTGTWNVLLTAYAMRKDIDSTLRLYQQMSTEEIPLDSMTYAAIMQALARTHQTDAAYKILRTVMPDKNVRVLAFHYAVVMSGYTYEGSFDKVFRVHERMQARGIKPTISTRTALLRAQALQEMTTMKRDGINHTEARLPNLEVSLQKILEDTDAIEIADKQPQKGLGQAPFNEAYPDAYFEVIINIYGSHGSYEVVKDLFNRYTATKTQLSDRNSRTPLRMLTALMNAHYHAGEHDEVEKCWHLAQAQADRFASLSVSLPTSSTSTSSSPPASTHSDPAPSQQTPTELPRIAPSRRTILSRPLQTYLRSLASQSRYATISTTVATLLRRGYTLDSHAWNLHVEILARRGRILSAFRACETRLMPAWRGWDPRAAERVRKGWFRRYEGGHRFMNRVERPGVCAPTWRTVVVLRAAVGLLKKQGVMEEEEVEEGRGGEEAREGEAAKVRVDVDVLRREAPRTMEAVEGMPLLGDRLQRRFLREELEEEPEEA